tara:strand:+ start:1696 stop:1971 length:276 start_codon:yes stop_codon:yes gene_type:complete
MMMMTVLDNVRNMNAAELNRVVDEIKLRRTFLAKHTARNLRVGDTVSFEGRRGETVTGTVTKVNQKTVIVKAGMTNWKVTASLLTPLAIGG